MIPHRIRSKSELDSLSKVLKEFYHHRPDSYGLMDRPEHDYRKYAEVIRHYTDPGGIVLDLGCGTYRSPLMIHSMGFQTTGCDLFSDDKLIAYRQAVLPQKIDLIAYDGHNLPFENNHFNTVASLCMFEHLSNVDQILNEMVRVLKPGGKLIIMGPNISGPHRGILGIIQLIRGKSRFWQFTNIMQCLIFIIRSFGWTFIQCLSSSPRFLYMYPLIRDKRFLFERPDDDAIHLNLPVSFWRWFRHHGCKIMEFNSRVGDHCVTQWFNLIFPWFATFIQMVVEKKHSEKPIISI